MARNYYDVLGVPRTASPDEIKRAYKGLARKYHPDVNKDEDAEGRFKEIIEAFEVLEKPERRTEYDRMLSAPRAEGNQTANPRTADEQVFDAVFNAFFGSDSARRATTQPQRQTVSEVLMAESDVGFLAALIEAYKAKEDGEWLVKKGLNDDREWMPEHIFEIRRKDGKVSILRTLKDWRDKTDRGKEIIVYDERYPHPDSKRTRFSDDTYFSMAYIYGSIKRRVEGNRSFPSGYKDFIESMNALAQKIIASENGRNSDISGELKAITSYNSLNSSRTRKVNDILYKNDRDRELVVQIPTNELGQKLRTAKEGQVRTPLEIKREKEGSPIIMPETDIALLSALVTAYKILPDQTKDDKEPKEWHIRKDREDKREFMPDEIYRVVRKPDGTVQVLRVIEDLRPQYRRKQRLDVKDPITGEVSKERSLAPGSFVGEFYLSGKGRGNLAYPEDIPENYGRYLIALKELAQVIAKEEKRLEGVLRDPLNAERLGIINEYNKTSGRIAWDGREPAKEISVRDFSSSLEEGKKRRVYEVNQRTTPEGRVPPPGESRV